MERALEALPEVEELAPLRDALIGLSRPDPDVAWSTAGDYVTLDVRLADVAALEGRIPELAEAVRQRTERVFGQVTAALRALGEGDDAAAARALIRAGEIEEEERRLEQAERYFAQAQELGRRPRERGAEGLALRRLGRVARAQGQLDRARDLYRRSLAIAEAVGDLEGRVVSCTGLGNVHADHGMWSEARDWYRKGLEALPEDSGLVERIHLCNGLSAVERRMGNLEESERWLEAGEAHARSNGDPSAAGYLENGRALLFLAQARDAEAETLLRRALTRELDPFARTGIMINLAEPILRQNRLAEAAAVARDAEQLAVRSRVITKLPEVYRVLGAIARARQQPDGVVFYEQALRLCRAHRLSPLETATTQQEYALFEAELGAWESAEARLEEAIRSFAGIGAVVERRAASEALEKIRGRNADRRPAPPTPLTKRSDDGQEA